MKSTGKEDLAPSGRVSPQSELLEALEKIAGGFVPNAATLAISGDWCGLYEALQSIARAAIEAYQKADLGVGAGAPPLLHDEPASDATHAVVEVEAVGAVVAGVGQVRAAASQPKSPDPAVTELVITGALIHNVMPAHAANRLGMAEFEAMAANIREALSKHPGPVGNEES